MKNLFFIGLGLLTILTSCATILSGTKANVTVTTNSTEPVNLTVDGRTYYNIAGLTQIQVKRGYKVSKIVAENTNAYGSVDVYKEFNAVTLGNLILGGIPSFIIDVIDGAVTKPATDVFHHLYAVQKQSAQDRGIYKRRAERNSAKQRRNRFGKHHHSLGHPIASTRSRCLLESGEQDAGGEKH